MNIVKTRDYVEFSCLTVVLREFFSHDHEWREMILETITLLNLSLLYLEYHREQSWTVLSEAYCSVRWLVREIPATLLRIAIWVFIWLFRTQLHLSEYFLRSSSLWKNVSDAMRCNEMIKSHITHRKLQTISVSKSCIEMRTLTVSLPTSFINAFISLSQTDTWEQNLFFFLIRVIAEYEPKSTRFWSSKSFLTAEMKWIETYLLIIY